MLPVLRTLTPQPDFSIDTGQELSRRIKERLKMPVATAMCLNEKIIFVSNVLVELVSSDRITNQEEPT